MRGHFDIAMTLSTGGAAIGGRLVSASVSTTTITITTTGSPGGGTDMG